MSSEEIYRLICRLYWTTDLTKDEIIELVGYKTLSKYCHTSSDGYYYKMAGKDAVNKIIHNEILAHTQVKIFTKQP